MHQQKLQLLAGENKKHCAHALAKNFNLIQFFLTLCLILQQEVWNENGLITNRPEAAAKQAAHTHIILFHPEARKTPSAVRYAPLVFPFSTEFADAVADARRDAMRQNKNQSATKPAPKKDTLLRYLKIYMFIYIQLSLCIYHFAERFAKWPEK